MKKHLEKLRKEPEEKKKKIVKILAITTTVIIVIIWLILLSVTSSPNIETNKEGNKFFDTFNQVLDKSINDFNEIKEEYDDQESFSDILEQAVLETEKGETKTEITLEEQEELDI